VEKHTFRCERKLGLIHFVKLPTISNFAINRAIYRAPSTYSVNSDGLSPLDVAVLSNNRPLAKMLVAFGAQEGNQCKYNRIQLRTFHAAQRGRRSVTNPPMGASRNSFFRGLSLSLSLPREKNPRKSSVRATRRFQLGFRSL